MGVLMNTPVTTIDEVYSDSAAVAIEWDETSRILQAAELFWVCTVRADGRPHVTPVVGVWVDGAVWFSTGDIEQKFANMRGNPHVVVTTGCNRWDGGVHVTDEAVLSEIAASFTTRWDGRWQFAVRNGAFEDPADGAPGQAQVFK